MGNDWFVPWLINWDDHLGNVVVDESEQLIGLYINYYQIWEVVQDHSSSLFDSGQLVTEHYQQTEDQAMFLQRGMVEGLGVF